MMVKDWKRRGNLVMADREMFNCFTNAGTILHFVIII